MLHVFSALSRVPIDTPASWHIKAPKLNFYSLSQWTLNRSFGCRPKHLVETNTYDQRILTAAVLSGNIDPGGPNRQSNGNSATIYSTNHSLTPWKACSKILAFTKCTLCFISQSIRFICCLNWFSPSLDYGYGLWYFVIMILMMFIHMYSLRDKKSLYL